MWPALGKVSLMECQNCLIKVDNGLLLFNEIKKLLQRFKLINRYFCEYQFAFIKFIPEVNLNVSIGIKIRLLFDYSLDINYKN